MARTRSGLVPYVGGEGNAAPYAEIAERLGMTEGAVKVAVHRLRAAYRLSLRAEVRDTVGDGVDVDDEIRDLLVAVWGPGYGEDTQVLRSHVANLRRKIEPEAGPRYIKTDPGVGYRFAG